MLFSDEKVFTVEPPLDLQNDRVYNYAPVGMTKRLIAPRRLQRTRSRFSTSVMICIAVSKMGMTELIFVDRRMKVKRPVLPRCLTVSADAASDQACLLQAMFVFQQDNAPSHRVKDTIKLLQQETTNFIGSDLWPPNSPDLNPVDSKAWGVMQQRVYECCVNSVDELKQRFVEVWNSLQHVIDAAINEWRKRQLSLIHI